MREKERAAAPRTPSPPARASTRRHRRRRRRRLRRGGDASARRAIAGDDRRCSAPTPSPPVDRPNLSKDYLAGNAPEEWIRSGRPSSTPSNEIELRARRRASRPSIPRRRRIAARWRREHRLRRAPAGDRRRAGPSSTVPGARPPHVHYLRTLADSRAIIAAAKRAASAPSSSARASSASRWPHRCDARGLEVHVVAPEARPMERVLGPELGGFVRALHEEHGVVFHLEDHGRSHRRKTVSR